MDNHRQGNRESDLVLPPNTHALVLNKQKGEVDVFVGPHKSNLDANTDQPVKFDYTQKKFVDCLLSQSIQTNVIAPEGWYLILKNPAEKNEHPRTGQNGKVTLNIGNKVNIQGPTDFALFPGQMCKVVQGHHLRTNQYLIVRVYDEDSAKNNWHDGVMKEVGEGEDKKTVTAIDKDKITMGKVFVIKGTNVSFYIPPTGVEVLRQDNKYAQEAVTLERLDYCMLLDEDGNKSYVKGPAVVFPEPTEQFIKDKEGHRKYRAITLNELSGLYINVIADYEEGEPNNKFTAGEELFITGKTQPIYYPRSEHAIIKYGKKMKHHAIAIPKGSGSYVINRNTGEIKLVKGATMLLCDPRTEIIVKRVLSIKSVTCWFPNNQEALQYNQNLLSLKNDSSYITDESVGVLFNASNSDNPSLDGLTYASPTRSANFKKSPRESSGQGHHGDMINRGETFNKPRSISLESSKFDGAIRIKVWRGYAICVESTSKESEVIVGSVTKLLEYDEDLVTMELSRTSHDGSKSSDVTLKTPYLRTLNNRISDKVNVVTKDLCNVTVNLSYMVNFREEDKDKWFDVENYVQFLCERMRSMIQRMAKQNGIEDFYQNHIDLIRDLILDKPLTDKEEPKCRYFSENGMYISDVEISSCELEDDGIEEMLNDSQIETVRNNLEVARQDRSLALTKKVQETDRSIQREKSHSRQVTRDLQKDEIDKSQVITLLELQNTNDIENIREDNNVKLQTIYAMIAKARLEIKRTQNVEEQENQLALVEIDGKRLQAENKAFAEKFKTVTPELISAMNSLRDSNLIVQTSKNLSINTILADTNVSTILQKALGGSSLGNNLEQMLEGFKALKPNGNTKVKN